MIISLALTFFNFCIPSFVNLTGLTTQYSLIPLAITRLTGVIGIQIRFF